MYQHYPAIIHKDRDSDYGVSLPDFPGCVSAGTTVEEALHLGAEAMQLHIDGMVEDGEPVPAPGAVEQHLGDGVLAMIRARLPARTRRVNISVDEDLLADIDAAARSRGLNRSAFLVEGARRLIREG